jgi:glycosyltransferase involved in cell wall biosynthesis
MANDLGLNNRVHFLGRVPHEELESWYSKALCVIVPSRYPETFGLIGPEAMRLGAPLIGTKVGAIGEWLEDGTNGYMVPPNDPDALADSIDRILSDPKRADTMGRAGRKQYEAAFTPERHVDALSMIFQTVAERGPIRA